MTSLFNVDNLYVFNKLKSQEAERTEWHERMIALTTALIHDECERLGISDMIGPSSDRFIFLQAEDYYQEIEDDYEASAFYSPDRRFSVLNVDGPRTDLFAEQMHESIHAHSFHSFMSLPEHTVLGCRRIGIAMEPPTQNARFTGANEAVTERLRLKLCRDHQDDIQKTMEFTDEEITEVIRGKSYPRFIELLDLINDRIADENHTTRDEIWDMWTKAMITGEMMSLRQVERVWGEGSLRILSMLGYDKKIDAKVFKFFGTMSHDAAEKIRRELLDL